MALTQRAIAAQEALRTEQEQYVAWALPTGIAEHNREFQETKIIFPSGSKIAIDWPAFEKGETQCLWLGYPLPTELAEALKEWDFKTLFLSQEQDHDVQLRLKTCLEFIGDNKPSIIGAREIYDMDQTCCYLDMSGWYLTIYHTFLYVQILIFFCFYKETTLIQKRVLVVSKLKQLAQRKREWALP